MKTLRYLAAILMLISGICQALVFIGNLETVTILVIGIAFAFFGILMFMPVKLVLSMEMVPVIGIILIAIDVGLKNIDLSMSTLIFMDIFISIYAFLLLQRRKSLLVTS